MDVTIKKVDPGRFASFYGFGRQPEEEALSKMLKWCEERNISAEDKNNVIFGFNNPNPIPNSELYGFEFWLKVDEKEQPEGDVRIVEYHGGKYAVTECKSLDNMLSTWRALYKWCLDNNHKLGYHRAWEKIGGNITDPAKVRIELYCPIAD